MSMEVQLPTGWSWVALGELLCEPLKNGHSAKASPNQMGVRTLTLTAVTKNDFSAANTKLTVANPDDVRDLWLKAGDILIERSNTPELVGTAALFRGAENFAIFPDLLIRVRLNSEVDARYIETVLATPVSRLYFRKRAQGIAGSMPKISQGTVLSLPVPLAPKRERQRIVERLDELLSDLDAGVAALERARANLRKYRAAVLKAAVTGELTADWRAAHRHVEPATKLLDRVLAERRRKWEADQQARFTATGKSPPRNWQEKYPEPALPDTTGLPELPRRWCWTRVSQAGEVKLGRQRSPEHHHGPHMRPYLRVANVFENRIDTSDVLQMNFTPDEYEVYRLKHGDILLNEGQSLHLVGRPAMYRDEVPGACFQNTLVRFRAAPGLVPEFALYVFLAYLHNKRFQKIARWTVNIAHLGAERFSNVEFPLPPADEQRAIVAEVERQLTDIKATEDYIAASLKRAGRLRQSILKEAFAGRLVPQDPNDEPASALLDRIRGANGAAADIRPRGRRKRADQPNLFE
jgi:type I restriction enzyme S subunit